MLSGSITLLGCKVSTYRKNLDFFLSLVIMQSVTADSSLRSPTGGVEELNPAPHIHETNDYVKLRINGYDNINLEPNAMNNIDTVAHMNMHYTQY